MDRVDRIDAQQSIVVPYRLTWNKAEEITTAAITPEGLIGYGGGGGCGATMSKSGSYVSCPLTGETATTSAGHYINYSVGCATTVSGGVSGSTWTGSFGGGGWSSCCPGSGGSAISGTEESNRVTS